VEEQSKKSLKKGREELAATVFIFIRRTDPINQKKSRADQKQIREEQNRSRAEQQNRAESRTVQTPG
jgi:hypothetical protein